MREPLINVSNWEQLRLFPPEQIRIELVVYLEGRSETVSIGWKVSDETSDEVIEMGIDSPEPMAFGLSRWFEVSEVLWERSRAALGPF